MEDDSYRLALPTRAQSDSPRVPRRRDVAVNTTSWLSYNHSSWREKDDCLQRVDGFDADGVDLGLETIGLLQVPGL